MTTTSLPAGVINTAYNASLQASGGVQPYTWSLGLGSNLPPGLTLNSNGTITGTPTATGTTSFTVTVTDSQLPTSNTATANLSITINATQPPAVTTTSSNLPTGIQNSAYPSTTLQASGGVTPYSWAVTAGALPTGLSLSTAGVITGTPTATGAFNFTVTVTDSEQPAKTATANLSITVNGPLAITTTSPLPSGVVNTAYSDTLKTSGGIGPYTWALQTGSSLPAGLTLSTGGVISGTPTATGTTSFTVQVTDSENPTVTVSATLSLTINASASCTNNSRLSGNYVFLFQGWSNASGGADLLDAVGSFTADGLGNVTSGLVDTNEPSSGYQSGTFTGTYCVGSNGLGTMTLIYSAPINGTLTYAIAVQSGGNGNFIEYDTNGISGSGFIKKRSTTTFTTSMITGNYGFGFIGIDGTLGARMGAAGTFHANGAGSLSSGEMEVDDDGLSPNPTASTLTFSASNLSVASTGRGTVTLAVTGKGNLNFVFYVASAADILAMGTDSVALNNPLLAGEILQQSGTFTNASMNGVAIVELQSLSSGGTAPAVTAGLATANGAGSVTISLDQNKGGTMGTVSGTGTYSVASNGRVTLSGLGNNSPVFYLVSQNKGFMIGTDNGVEFGVIEPQSGSSFTNASLSGTFVGGSREPQDTTGSSEIDSVTADGAGNVSGTSENNSLGGTPSQGSISATYSVASNGKVTVTQGGQVGVCLYIVSTSKFVVVPVGDTSPKLTILQK